MCNAAASVPAKGLLRDAAIDEHLRELAPPAEAKDIVAYYRYIGLTLVRHPLTLLRPSLYKMRFTLSQILNDFQDGQLARGCGIRTVHQWLVTASGVIFLMLEDQFGIIHFVVWPRLIKKQRR